MCAAVFQKTITFRQLVVLFYYSIVTLQSIAEAQQDSIVEQVRQVDPAIYKWYKDRYWDTCGQIERRRLPERPDDSQQVPPRPIYVPVPDVTISPLINTTVTPRPVFNTRRPVSIPTEPPYDPYNQHRSGSNYNTPSNLNTRTLSISFPSEAEEARNLARQDQINRQLLAQRYRNDGQANINQGFRQNSQQNQRFGSYTQAGNGYGDRNDYTQRENRNNRYTNGYYQPEYGYSRSASRQNNRPQVIRLANGDLLIITRKRRSVQQEQIFYPTVVGGQEALNTYPWMVPITAKGYDDKYVIWCGSSLITDRHLLTAAHCFDIRQDPQTFSALIRAHNLSQPEEVVDLKTITIHPDYQPGKFYNDVAIVTLAKPVTKFSPVCLPISDPKGVDDVGANVEVLGYGSLAFAERASETLQVAKLEVFDNSGCNANYSSKQDTALNQGIIKSQLCAGAKDGTRDACQNDSGGPLINDAYLGRRMVVGVVSFGFQCAREGFPGVYSRVKEFLPWIMPTMRRLS